MRAAIALKFVAPLMLSMTVLACAYPASLRQSVLVDEDARILAGGMSPVGGKDGKESLRRLFLAYPTSNFGYPIGAYGVYIDLVPPLTANQWAEINGSVIFVAVRKGPFRNTGDFSGEVIGYGVYPQGPFEPFTLADLRNEDVFIPLTREP